jgi:hypothetical protein
MRHAREYKAVLAGLMSILVAACSNPMSSDVAGSGASTSTSTSKNSPAVQDAGAMQYTGPLRCAPSPGMLDACSQKAAGDACSLSGKRDGGWTFPGSCRSTFDGTGLACVPTPPAPQSFLVDACSGKPSGVACAVTGPSGRSFEGVCITGRASSTLFCGRSHTPPAAVVDACSGKSAGDGCTRPEHRDGGTKPGICGNGPAGTGPLACRAATSPGVAACSGLEAGATCTLGFGHTKHGEDGAAGSCVVPAAGGAASCLVSCMDLFHRRHHGHGFGGHGPPWWNHRASDGGTASP